MFLGEFLSRKIDLDHTSRCKRGGRLTRCFEFMFLLRDVDMRKQTTNLGCEPKKKICFQSIDCFNKIQNSHLLTKRRSTITQYTNITSPIPALTTFNSVAIFWWSFLTSINRSFLARRSSRDYIFILRTHLSLVGLNAFKNYCRSLW